MKSTAVVTLIALSFPAAFLMGAAEAEACSEPPQEVQWSYPGEGDEIGPDQELMVVVFGGGAGSRTIRLLDEGGEEVDFTYESEEMPGSFFETRLVISPEEPLSEGAYMLEVEYDRESTLVDNYYAANFRVNEDLSSDVPGPVTVEWYRETYGEGIEAGFGECYYGEEYNRISLEPLEEEVAYYQTILQKEGEPERVHILEPSAVDGSFRDYLEPANCVTVYAVALDGTPGDEVEICTPDKCNHVEPPGQFNSTDWEQIEGCEPDADGDGDGDDNNNSDSGACSQSGSPVPSPGLLVVLVAMGLVWRRRSK